MSGFKFDFSSNSDDETTKLDENCIREDDVKWIPAKEIFPSKNIIENIDDIVLKANIFICGDLEIGHVHCDEALQYLKSSGLEDLDNNVLLAESQQSDLLPGKYEGGLKVWECTSDLAEYIDKNDMVFTQNCRVLDLGCGAGILGIIALLSGAEVHFQDYNEEVINAVTIPNVVLNTLESKDDIKTRCKFFSGDWGSLSEMMELNADQFKYDYILTSETIYNSDNHNKLYSIIKNRLKETGVALVSAKTYYFGVGGGMREFQYLVQKDGFMDDNICWKSTGGVSREIMKLVFKNKT